MVCSLHACIAMGREREHRGALQSLRYTAPQQMPGRGTVGNPHTSDKTVCHGRQVWFSRNVCLLISGLGHQSERFPPIFSANLDHVSHGIEPGSAMLVFCPYYAPSPGLVGGGWKYFNGPSLYTVARHHRLSTDSNCCQIHRHKQ